MTLLEGLRKYIMKEEMVLELDEKRYAEETYLDSKVYLKGKTDCMRANVAALRHMAMLAESDPEYLLERLREHMATEERALNEDLERLEKRGENGGALYLAGKTQYSAGNIGYIQSMVESEERRMTEPQIS